MRRGSTLALIATLLALLGAMPARAAQLRCAKQRLPPSSRPRRSPAPDAAQADARVERTEAGADVWFGLSLGFSFDASDLPTCWQWRLIID